MPLLLHLRAVVFGLAFLSFACLLGQFFGFWTMHVFGCWVLPPATALLAIIAYRARRQPAGVASPHTWIVQGAIGGVVAALAYDLYRLPFALSGAPLFKVFPRFAGIDADKLADELLKTGKEKVPDYAFDCHTLKGKRMRKTKAEFFREEQRALKPFQPGLFDGWAGS